jgi:hypothetical protein
MYTINDIPFQKIHEGERVDLTQEEREQMLSEWNLEAERIAQHNALKYQRDRVVDYPPIGDQLDALFHAGVFPAEMAAKIQAVKDKYPKV